MTTYQAIEDYGVIGNMRTVAMVATNGRLDWLCFPRFDSPSVFAAILDDEKGGHFSFTPLVEEVRYKQFYWTDTNVLVTRFFTSNGVAELIDFMPVKGDEKARSRVVRCMKVVSGEITFRLECAPAFNYARDRHEVSLDGDHGACFFSDDLSLALSASVPLTVEGDQVCAEFTLATSQSAQFTLQGLDPDEACPPALNIEEFDALFDETVHYWRHWLAQCTYRGRWREVVYRSALALKLMTYEPTGAIVAAPTCSLPEYIGGTRNWDYRYTWMRDAAFTVYALLRIGFTQEADAFLNWLAQRCREAGANGPLQVLYTIDGTPPDTTETVLDHLEGHRGSKPVRIGNSADEQIQLDVYGEVLDAVYLYNKYGKMITYDLWLHVRELVDWVCEHWRRKDQGVWEVRGAARSFVYSKVMCWVAVDRGLRIADKRSFPCDRARWLKVRDEIHDDIMTNGWNEKRGTFTQYYGSDELDAANLMMSLVFFLAPDDPKILHMIETIRKPPQEGGLTAGTLVYRYDHTKNIDGIDEPEGRFNLCTFWLVEAMTRGGKVQEARLIFESMLGYANHLGLYAEEIGTNGEALGNFPQALTHLALISAAFNLDRALGQRAPDSGI